MIIPLKDGTGDTRLIPQTVFSHLDYLRISVTIDPCGFHELLKYCGSDYICIEPGKVWSCGSNAGYYQNKIVSCEGITGGYTDNLETNKIDVMIDFSGQYFQSISVENTWRLLLGLKHFYGVKCHRIDIAIDDPTFTLIPVDRMMQSCQDGNNFGFRKIKTITEEEIGKGSTTTRYFGSRNSGKMVRIYNHKNKFHRYETEYKRKYSQAVFDFLSSIERSWFFENNDENSSEVFKSKHVSKLFTLLGEKDICAGLENVADGLHGCDNKFDLILQRIMCSIAVTAIDFRDKSCRKDKSRASRSDCLRLDFYQEFMDKIGGEIKIKVSVDKTTLSKNIAWMQRSVSKSISIIRDGIGAIAFQDWINKLIDIGRVKQSSNDSKLVLFISNNKSVVRL